MSFINVESEEYQFRVIFLGGEPYVKLSPQVQKNCTGLMVEVNGSYSGEVYDVLKGLDGYNKTAGLKRLKPIRTYAKRHSLLLANALPLIIGGEKLYMEGVLNRKRILQTPLLPNPFRSFIDTLILLGVRQSGSGIEREDFLYNQLMEINQRRDRAYPQMLISLRNYLMAERLSALADFQSDHGVEKPSLALFTDVSNTGVAEALLQNPKDRKREITKECFRHYQISNSDEILHVEYNREQKKWITGTIVDSKLQIHFPIIKGGSPKC